MTLPRTILIAAAGTAFMSGCGRDCDGHSEADIYCRGADVVQCQQGAALKQFTCSSGECRDIPPLGPLCVLPGASCPTTALGYQCMGERRIVCYADDLVVDRGLCTALSPDRIHDGEGPYCVANPGGTVLACGWSPEKCNTEGEVRCFDDGSAICKGNVYRDFRSNAEAGQSVCDVTRVDNCWNGKTWCEGDVLKRCDKCLDEARCLKVSTQAVCSPGACTTYQPPAWLVEAGTDSGKSDAAGCVVDAPECSGLTGMACVGEGPAMCTGAGKAVVALSCAEIQSIMGVVPADDYSPAITKYGPLCVPYPGGTDTICALDAVPCDDGAFRCDPDSARTRIQRCKGGLWLRSWSCEQPSALPPTTVCNTTTSSAICQ